MDYKCDRGHSKNAFFGVIWRPQKWRDVSRNYLYHRGNLPHAQPAGLHSPNEVADKGAAG
jgi:hypothetical protein